VNGALILYLSVDFSTKSAGISRISWCIFYHQNIYLRTISEFNIFSNRWSRNCKVSVHGTS